MVLRFSWGLVLLVASLLASVPLLLPRGIIQGMDLPFYLGLIEGIRDGLASGQFPVRVNPVQLGGYGMLSNAFYPNVFLYFPAVLRLLGVPLLVCWKIFLVSVNLLTAFLGWWGFSKLAQSERIGAVASLLYLVGFYRFFLLLDGSSAPPVLAMAFFPAAVASIWAVLQRDASDWPFVVLFSTCVFESHILTGIFLVGTAVAMAIVSLPHFRQADVRRATGKSVAFLFLLNIWFYAPLVYFHTHMDFVMKDSVSEQGIWKWTIMPLRQCDFYVGSAMLLLLIVLAVWMFLKRKGMGARPFWCLLAASAVILYLLASPKFWHMLGPAAGFLQFPGRLALFPAMFLALAAGIGLTSLPWQKAWHLHGAAFLCATVIFCANVFWLSGRSYAIPPHPHHDSFPPPIQFVPDDVGRLDIGYHGYKDYMDTQALAAIQQQADGAIKGDPLPKLFQDREISPSERIQDVVRRSNDFVIRYATGEAGVVRLPLFWYDGYVAEAQEGEPCYVQRGEEGQVSLLLPASSGVVHVHYEGLPWFHLTDLVSWFGSFFFFFLVYREHRFRKRGF